MSKLLPSISRVVLALLLVWAGIGTGQAEQRHPDPDGCFSCHGLPDLKYIDKHGQLRSATILKADYYASLHGSVSCKDCHRKITDYPHEEKDGLVDCAESCHLKEPSAGKPFTHKAIAEEFKASAHGKGWTKEFAAGNRAKEDQDSSLPSCRRCHTNEAYIADSQRAAFQEEFQHFQDKDTVLQCGTCHTGEVWREQFSGHILRRYIGNRISKQVSNAICKDCHGNHEKMAKVEQEHPVTKAKQPVGPRFIYATESYDKTLHGRLLHDGSLHGASCVECHAPTGLHHGIKRDDDPLSSVNELHLSKTCGQAGCHQDYAKSGGSYGFLTTDMHNPATVGMGVEAPLADVWQKTTHWHTGAVLLGSLATLFLLGNVIWRLFNNPDSLSKTRNNSLLGGEHFQRVIIGSKPKAKPRKPAPGKDRKPPSATAEPEQAAPQRDDGSTGEDS